jgi:transcriptional regulator with PAS, ATPase and Fis domain
MQPTTTDLRQRLRAYEREILLEAMETHQSRQEQGRALGLSHVTLWRRLRDHGLIG